MMRPFLSIENTVGLRRGRFDGCPDEGIGKVTALGARDPMNKVDDASAIAQVTERLAEIRKLFSILAKLLTCMARDDPLHRKCLAAQVLLLAIEAMYRRYEKARSTPFPIAVLHLKVDQLYDQLCYLIVESRGYYSLPAPDPARAHNQPPIGPDAGPDVGSRGQWRLNDPMWDRMEIANWLQRSAS